MRIHSSVIRLSVAIALTPFSCLLAQQPCKTMNACRKNSHITIDGHLTDAAWHTAPVATNFVQSAPQPGMPSRQRTEVRMMYDDDAIYIGAIMHEKTGDSVVHQLSPRDDFEDSNTDAFGVNFDTYLDRQNALQFVVTAAGVQADGIVRFDGVDRSWNAAWFSRVSHTDSGWSVEMKIPYAALRFPKKSEQQWGVNFMRIIRRSREKSYWNTVNPAVPNATGQAGRVDSISNIKSPVRLALLPYISGYASQYADAKSQSINGGLDLKYGLSESFTLDMTLVPDFGQTRFDNKVLNLSPIEVRYDERRYFFTEGVNLFNKNDLFYSRRVGGTPINAGNAETNLSANEVVISNPAATRLYNAFKISGRTGKSTGLGFFNAVSASTAAIVKDTINNTGRSIETSPLTNYNVIVVDQALKNNSNISFVNTSVLRAGSTYDANVSSVLYKFANKANSYGFNGSTDISQRIYTNNNDVGHRTMLNGGKLSGNYTWSLNTKVISDNFNPNDLGYLDRNNLISAVLYNVYNTYKPFGHINTTYNKIGLEYYRAYNPATFAKAAMHGNHVVTFTSFHTIGAYWDAQPGTANDYFEPRTKGRYYQLPANAMTGGFISSDYRRRFALDLEGSRRWFGTEGRNVAYMSVSPRFRFTNKLSAIYSFWTENKNNDVGFVARQSDSVYLGTRKLQTTVNSLYASYIFTRTMSLALDARHYWAQANYTRYDFLNTDGTLQATGYTNNHNTNFNSFNLFMNFIWQFRPGSEMSIVYQNSVYTNGTTLATDYMTNLRNNLQAPQSNSLSLKVIYYLDYQTIANAITRKQNTTDTKRG